MSPARSDAPIIVQGPGMTVDRRALTDPLPLNPRGEIRPELSPALHGYRVSWEFAIRGGPPHTIRLRDRAEGPLAEIATSYLCQAPNGYGRALERRTIDVPRDTWARIVACIDGSGFWAMPEQDPAAPTTDGSRVSVEAAASGRYHVVSRHNLNVPGAYGQDPGAAALKSCLALIHRIAERG